MFHGADKDIEWLQRDFGLYVVNMFDTGQAARVLNEERYSLAYLLHKYCQVEAQKQFQLADWRIRYSNCILCFLIKSTSLEYFFQNVFLVKFRWTRDSQLFCRKNFFIGNFKRVRFVFVMFTFLIF